MTQPTAVQPGVVPGAGAIGASSTARLLAVDGWGLQPDAETSWRRIIACSLPTLLRSGMEAGLPLFELTGGR